MKNQWFRQSPPNKNLYNGGSEWQNDTKAVNAGVPDYYQTFYRNYDPALARFVAVDPEAEGAESMSDYHYAGDNPIVWNDAGGNMSAGANAWAYISADMSQEQAYQNYDSGGRTGSGSAYGRNYGGIPDADRSDFSFFWIGEIAWLNSELNALPQSTTPGVTPSYSGSGINGTNSNGSFAQAGQTTLAEVSISQSIRVTIVNGEAVVNGLWSINIVPDLTDGDEGDDQGGDPYAFAGEYHLRVNGNHLLPPQYTTNIQYRNTCFFKVIEWVSRYLGNTINSGVPQKYAAGLMGVNPNYFLNNGITNLITGQVLDEYFDWFYTLDPSVIVGVVDNNRPIISAINTGEVGEDGNPVYHAVFITGWSGDVFTYFDPLLGTYQSTGFYNFKNGFIIVTGLKPQGQ